MSTAITPTSVYKETFQYGSQTVTIETGNLAQQSTGSVTVTMGDTVVLVSVVSVESTDPSRNFFPLTVIYQEKFYAAGKIPGGYFKRESRPTEKEVIVCRLIDRPIRPLFPKDYIDEVQVIAYVLSSDANVPADIPAMIGASAALTLSGIPFHGPIAAARVGYLDNAYKLNPSAAELAESRLDLVVAGTEKSVLMVESKASELTEAEMLDAIYFGQQQMQVVIEAIKNLQKQAGGATTTERTPNIPDTDSTVYDIIHSTYEERIAQAYAIPEKIARNTALKTLRADVVSALCDSEDASHEAADVLDQLKSYEKSHVRNNILQKRPRIDGRTHDTVRPITINLNTLPRAHGSALFTRGETQALVVTTLGGERDAQMLDDISGEARDPFMLHYNFPPFSVGEAGMVTGPKRREIGHGTLAKRAIQPVLPDLEAFPYVLRVVSEILSCNGSSSMATVCGTSLSMMAAGVPLKKPVAGIAMGLIKEQNDYVVLSDILGDEDHLGDMDFKVAGTDTGITALQMDIKIDGIDKDIMQAVLKQANTGRLHILNCMNEAISTANELSAYAPRLITMQVKTDKIRDVIGRGGATIREITEKFGVTIDINDSGLVKINATDTQSGEEAREYIKQLTSEAEIGNVFEGKIVKIMDFGAFVSLPVGRDGFLHISQIKEERVYDINDELKEGDIITVKVTEIDKQNRIKLTMRDVSTSDA